MLATLMSGRTETAHTAATTRPSRERTGAAIERKPAHELPPLDWTTAASTLERDGVVMLKGALGPDAFRKVEAAGTGAIETPDDLPDKFIDNLAEFWINKDRLEGKEFKPLGVQGPAAAVELVRLASRAAKKAA